MHTKEINKSQNKSGSSEEDVPAARQATERHQQRQQQQSKVHPPPLEHFQDTVILRKPFGLRVHKTSLQVTYVENPGPSVGRVSIGDTIVAVDRQKITSINELNTVLRKPSPIQMALRATDMVDVNEMLGLSVKYDSKERIQVAATAANSLSSVHLRPGDVIREVNEYPIASKTMLDHFIQAGVTANGQVNFTIESPAGGIDAYRDQIDLANDVLEIAQKQIVQFRATIKSLNQPSILNKQRSVKSNKEIVISDKFVELPIGADYDPSKLKSCKGGNAEKAI